MHDLTEQFGKMPRQSKRALGVPLDFLRAREPTLELSIPTTKMGVECGRGNFSVRQRAILLKDA